MTVSFSRVTGVFGKLLGKIVVPVFYMRFAQLTHTFCYNHSYRGIAGHVGNGATHIQRTVNCQNKRKSGFGNARLPRSEEHTSELQSRENLVCRLLLEKKKQKKNI